jgi:hypothetical protein
VSRQAARRVALALLASCCVMSAEPLLAQTAPRPRPAPRKPPGPPGPARFEVAFGAAWLAGYGLGQREATLTENVVPTGGRFTLFRTRSEMGGAPGLNARFGVRVTRRLAAETGLLYSRPELATVISGDVEQPLTFTATERLSEYAIEGAVRYGLRRETPQRRLMPFVTGGVGYLRQLSGDRTAVETGTIYHGGAGVLVPLRARPRGTVRQVGLRGDARASWRAGGFDVEETTRASLAVAGLLYLRF